VPRCCVVEAGHVGGRIARNNAHICRKRCADQSRVLGELRFGLHGVALKQLL